MSANDSSEVSVAEIIDFMQWKKDNADADVLEIAQAIPDFDSLNEGNKTIVITMIKRILDSLGKYKLPNLEGIGLTEMQAEHIYIQCTGSYQNMLHSLSWLLGGYVALSVQSLKRQDTDENE